MDKINVGIIGFGTVGSGTVQALLEYSVTDLVKTVLAVCAPHVKMPAKLQNPPALQKWLESLHVKNYKAMAPPPIAKLRDQS